MSLQSTPTVLPQQEISPKELNLAKDKIKYMMDKLASPLTFVEFNFSNDDLSAISKLGTHLLPETRTKLVTTGVGVVVSTTTKITFVGDWYLNLTCWLIQDRDKTSLSDCSLGNLPLPDGLLQWGIINIIHLVFSGEISETVEQLITGASYSNEQLIVKAQKSKYFRQEVNNSLDQLGDLATLYTQSETVSPEVVQLYVDNIYSINSGELYQYIRALAELASERSIAHDAVEENTAIIWSLAVVFGDYRFRSLIGVKKQTGKKSVPSLRGRIDLSLHFIYSAVLQQLGDIDIGLSIGEAKELLDSLKGGSGYSFADLAADKSGLYFAEFITSGSDNAIYAQKVLQAMEMEDDFFPYTHDLPEGFRDANFKRVIQSTESKNYQLVENEIDERIASLPLYKINTEKGAKQAISNWTYPSNKNNKYWFKIDTHIHTKFSDGNFSVADIAKQAYSYGCDAIAITDHGDHNLKNVASKAYFSSIESAQRQYPYMTIIPGLEWNIPPLRGREHVTVLLPESKNLQRNLSVFRARYDHYNRFDEKLLSPAEALDWLELHGQDNSHTAPVLIYNHPSRKDFQQQENQHDMVYWRRYSDLVIGFSGAPGHQKKRGNDNGSYSKKHRTINGWDPSIARVGGEWDRLLQQGYKLWAARASSDFHNTQMDYWPCQFSSTHINAASQKHNDVLKALQSGEFWAQHGDFVRHLDFKVKASESLSIGQEGYVSESQMVTVNLDLTLNDVDWQGKKINLTELELVIVTPSDIKTELFVPNKTGNKVNISYEHIVNDDFVIFRWRGRNSQNEAHDYMFYTNPIKVTRN